MITALVSALTGLVSGAAPNIIKEVTAAREHKRETERLQIQTELQLKIAQVQGNTRVAEMDRGLESEAYRAASSIATQSMKATGIRWVDAWNGSLRPFAVTIIIVLFAVMASCYTYAVLTTVTDMQQAVTLLWGSLIGEAIQAVLGFLFGYRSAQKK